jgi:surface antigen
VFLRAPITLSAMAGRGGNTVRHSLARLGLMGLFCAFLCACASPDYADLPPEPGQNVVSNAHHAPLQCVPYVRNHSDVKLHGDAYTWWDQAEGRFARGAAPQEGAVMVLNNYAGPARAHVAVVRRVVSAREIRVDHANWLDDGAIYIDDPVVDVSADNDWSRVKVWNIKAGAWGTRIYPVQGFIGPDSAADSRLASADQQQYN